MVKWRLVLGLLLLPVILHIYLYCVFSRDGLFNQIKLGSPWRDAVDAVEQAGVTCDATAHNVLSATPYLVCNFEDPWRDYTVAFDVNLGIVTSKSVRYKRILPIHARAIYFLIAPPRL